MKQLRNMCSILFIGLLLLTGCGDQYDYSYKGLPSTERSNNQTDTPTEASASNPITVYRTVEKAQDAIGFAFGSPSSLPSNYTLSEISVVNDKDTCFAQTDYKKDAYTITYRVSQVTENLNSDRNRYDKEKTIAVFKTDITCFCTGDMIFVATWQKDECFYCIMSDEGLDAPTLSMIIASIE